MSFDLIRNDKEILYCKWPHMQPTGTQVDATPNLISFFQFRNGYAKRLSCAHVNNYQPHPEMKTAHASKTSVLQKNNVTKLV